MAMVTEQVSMHRLTGGTTGQAASRLLIVMDVLGAPVPAGCPVPDAIKVCPVPDVANEGRFLATEP